MSHHEQILHAGVPRVNLGKSIQTRTEKSLRSLTEAMMKLEINVMINTYF